jgi:hypothetical protein
MGSRPVAALLKVMIQERFLTADRIGDKPAVSFAHERILLSWNQISHDIQFTSLCVPWYWND